MKRALLALSLVALALVACGPPIDDPNAERRTIAPTKRDSLLGPARGTVLLLGTYDLARAIRDPQELHEELRDVVDKLATFEPTVVAVGVPAGEQTSLDRHYEAWLEGKVKRRNDAIDRIAFPIAERAGLERVWAIDADPPPGNGGDLDAWAERHGQTDRLRQEIVARYERRFEQDRRLQSTESVEANLVWLNDRRRLAETHGRLLVGEFDLGEDGEWAGPDALLPWYGRNLRIFANLQRVAARRGDRVLVVIDAAHLSLLRHCVDASPRFDLVEVNEFLGVPQGATRRVAPLL